MINDDIPTCQRDCDSATVGVCLYLWADDSVSTQAVSDHAATTGQAVPYESYILVKGSTVTKYSIY